MVTVYYRAHLLLNGGDAVEIFDVVDDVYNDGFFPAARRQGAPDLLLVDDGGDGGAEKDHARDVVDVDALVEHVDAE